MTKYQDLLKRLGQVAVKAKKIIPEMCSCLGIEDPTLSDEEIKDRVKKDVIALGFSAEYVSYLLPPLITLSRQGKQVIYHKSPTNF